MKSYVKKFKYAKDDGSTTNRELFVMRENSTAIDGIELTYLDETQRKELLESLKDHEVREGFTKADSVVGDSFKPEWSKAWRRYNVSKIIIEKEGENDS